MTPTPRPPEPRHRRTTAAGLDPLGEAPEADVAEQEQTLDGSDPETLPDVSVGEADEGDVLEQVLPATDGTDDMDEDAWPHAGHDEPEDDRG